MALPPFPQTKEAQLLQWSAVFSAKITAGAASFGLLPAQSVSYALLHTAFASAYNAANDQNTNSKAAIGLKNQAKENLLNGPGGAWELVDICQAWPSMTDAKRLELNIKLIDSDPTPIPVPEFAPDLSIISTAGRMISVRLRDQLNPDRRGKPVGVSGATVLYHVGEALPPNDPTEWTFAMNTSTTTFDVEIPAGVAPGSKVWLTAFWFNNRKDSSPAATFESTMIGDQYAKAA